MRHCPKYITDIMINYCSIAIHLISHFSRMNSNGSIHNIIILCNYKHGYYNHVYTILYAMQLLQSCNLYFPSSFEDTVNNKIDELDTKMDEMAKQLKCILEKIPAPGQ